MAYSVTTNDGVTISVADEVKDSSSLSLTVIGRNATNYGQTILTNTVRHLENFASNTPPTPTYKLTGQLWYNKSENTMRVYDDSIGIWGRVSAVPVSATEISTDLTSGTQYFNSVEDKLKVYDGSSFRDAVLPGGTVTSAYSGNVAASASASNYGAKVETLFLQSTETSASVIPVLAIKYVSDGSAAEGELPDSAHNSANATVMALFSDRAFSLSPSDPYNDTLKDSNSFGNGVTATFTKGLNLRKDYTDATIAQATTSEWADKANAIFTGSIIPAADIVHVGTTNWVPSGTVSTNYTLGNATNRFGDLHVDQMQLGRGTGTQTLGINGTVNIGNASHEVNEIYVHDLTVSGNLDFDGINDLLNLENANIVNITLTSGTISSAPVSGNDITNKTYVDAKAIAATAAALTLVATDTSPATHYPVFVDAATGNRAARTDTGFTFIPSTDTLNAGTFNGTTGSFSGTVSGATVTSSGAVNGASGSFTGTVSGATGSFTGTVTAGTLSDGTATINSGVFSGTSTSARYADLAEKYTADADYEPGTVVKIGGSAEITQTTSHADTEVFGVISTDPAYLMNKDIDGLPVALQGRVPVKVVGKVRKGERLTTSDIPGVAWGVADEDVPLQAIIGRALEDKTDGEQGVVEAVIGVK